MENEEVKKGLSRVQRFYRRGRRSGNMLEVKNLMVFFENALALNDFSMRWKKGRSWA
jgi:hypothetical protein